MFKLKKESLANPSLVIFLNLFDISSKYDMENHLIHSLKGKLLFDLLVEQEFNLFINVLTLALIVLNVKSNG